MRSRAALLPLLVLALGVSLAPAGRTQGPGSCALLSVEPGEDAGGQLGCSVVAGAGGVILAAGANLGDGPQGRIEDAGSVTLFVEGSRNPDLFAPDAAPGDQFGFALAVDSLGTLAVGARFGDAPGARDAGAVYVYDGGRPDKITAPDALPGAQFGAAVALHDDVLAVGAPLDDERGTASGAVYLFTRTNQGWSLAQKIVSPRTAPFDNFGTSLALDGGTLAVGAPFADGRGGGEGAVHVFELAEGRWTEGPTLTASDAAPGDQLGFSLGLGGRFLAAGARRDDHGGHTDAGSVVMFERDGGAWRERAPRLTAGSSAGSGNLFGGAVALSGDRLLVGASLADGGNGAAFLFLLSSDGWGPPERIVPPEGAAGRFGFSVALSGGTAVAGAFEAGGRAGAVSLLDCSEPPLTLDLDLIGARTAFQGQTLTYCLRVDNVPAGTTIRHSPPPQLGRIASCRGEACGDCTPVPGPPPTLQVQGGDAVYTLQGQVRFGSRGRAVYGVEAVPPKGDVLRAEADAQILLPDLTCAQTGPELAVVGDTLTSSLAVKNQGNAPATRVLLPDPTPTGFERVSVGGSCSGFPCNLGTVPAGQTFSVEVRFRIPRDFAPVPQTVEKVTTVQSRETETSRDNNRCLLRFPVYPLGISPP
jgi:uncharacterized repeat protein (TIGR01451 family)